MIKIRLKFWVPVFVICFCWICNVEAAGRKELESSFLRKVKMVLENLQEEGLDIKEHPEKALKYDKGAANLKEIKLKLAKEFPAQAERLYKEANDYKLWTATNSIYNNKFAYDIRATNSLISPYVGIATFHLQQWEKKGVTKEECLKAPWKQGLSFKITSKFFYQNGQWIRDENPYVEIDRD